MNKSCETPIVSILLPAYNHEHFVEAAIESVYRQDFTEFELIVLDDGSTDQTCTILEKLQKKYRFQLWKQPNQGLINTLNRLGSLCSGKYISLFSSDDLYHPMKLTWLVDYLENNPKVPIVYSKIAQVDRNGEVIRVIDENYKEGYIFQNLLRGEFSINGISTLIRADVYHTVIRENLYIDDFQLWLSLSQSYKIGFVNQVTAYYRLHENHLSSDLIEMQKSEYQTLLRYADAEGFDGVLETWHLRWFGMLALRHKKYAFTNFFLSILSSKSCTTWAFLKGCLKLACPAFLVPKR